MSADAEVKVLGALHNGPKTRRQISMITGLSRISVTAVLHTLRRHKVVKSDQGNSPHKTHMLAEGVTT